MSEQAVRSLLQLIEQEHLLSSRLYEVLAQELAALERMDSESIQALAQEKNRLLVAIDLQLSLREKAQPNAFDDATLQRLGELAPLPLVNQLHQLMHDYRQMLARCHTQNDINGRIIAINRRSVERHLSLLRGHQPDAVIYTATGRATRMHGRQRFAVA
jgi:flagellar biosynthesis/type III secretory pathway chaperone